VVPAAERELFENTGVARAVMRLALPTVAGQIILVIYNVADTFFVGLAGDAAKLTAVTVCMPAFMILSAVANLFGIGGGSVMARAMGSGDSQRGRSAAAFAFWGCLTAGLVYSLLATAFRGVLVDLLGGTDPRVHRLAEEYLTLTVGVGGAATAMSVLFSHLIRSEGRSLHAAVGIALGGLLNIALDPLFMFVLLPPGREAFGAAVATVISNVISLIYFVLVSFALRQSSQLCFRPSMALCTRGVVRAVLVTGAPACIMTLFENLSYAVLDKLMSLNGVAAQAGIGVAKKVNMLAHCAVRGISQGALPLIAYNYAAGKLRRMRSAFRITCLMAVGAALVCMAANLIWSRELVGLFIHREPRALRYGTEFLRILCVGGPFSAAAYTVISFFQAVGQGSRSFLLAVLRKGMVDIPLMFALNSALPVFGIVMATPVTDALCCAAACGLYLYFINKLVRSAPRRHPRGRLGRGRSPEGETI